jgi:hypothetical protein
MVSIVRFCVVERRSFNDAHFSAEIDGVVEGTALVVAMEMGCRDMWVVALRGHPKPFNTAEGSQFIAILPFIVKSIAGFAANENQSIFDMQLSELLVMSTRLISTLSSAELAGNIRAKTLRLFQCEHTCAWWRAHRAAHGERVAAFSAEPGPRQNNRRRTGMRE